MDTSTELASRTRPRHRRAQGQGRRLRRAAQGDREDHLAQRGAHRRQLHRRLRHHAAAPSPERAAAAARQGRVRRPGRHLAPDRAVRQPQDQGDDLHARPHLRALSDSLRAAAKSGHEIADHMWEHRVPKEPELERDHLQQDHRGDREDRGQEAGRHAQHPQPRAAARARLHLHLRRFDGSSAELARRPGRLAADPQPAVPLRHRRRDVLQLRLARQRQQRPAHDGSRPCRGAVVAHVRAVLSRRRLHERLHASLRVGPRAAHRHARPADQPHEGAARRVVPELRGGRPPHHRSR